MPDPGSQAAAFPILANPETFRGQPCLRLQWGPRDSLLVALHGAHILSWTAAGAERLYLSPKALFDGRSAIRGGVPVCFPQFNERGPLPKHGFARNLRWSADTAERDTASGDVRLSLRLASDAASLALWPATFAFELEILLGPGRLRMTLAARNTGDKAWSFTGALHTYFRVQDLDNLRLQGLDGQACWDSLTDTRATHQGDVRFVGEFDRVFRAAPAPLLLLDGDASLHIEQSTGFADTVVWNPGAAKCAGMADMAPDSYAQMVCIEAAQVETPLTLMPGERWSGWQRLSLV